MPDSSRLLRAVGRAARSVARTLRSTTPPTPVRPDAAGSRRAGADQARGYPGDWTGPLRPVYAPRPDGSPDPGEIVWAWVPYEEDASRGKDRPVLLVGRDGPWLLGLMLTSVDHDARPARGPGRWLDLGTGDWDARRRPSEVRLDRVVRLDPAAVRREGAVLDRRRFDAVARALGSPGAW